MGLKTLSPVSGLRQGSIWLSIARSLLIAVICLTIGLFIISIPFNYEQRMIVCTAEPCAPGVLTPASERALGQIGLSVEGLIRITVALDIVIAIAYTVSAVIIFVRKPNDPLTIFTTVMLVTFGLGSFSGEIRGLGEVIPSLRWLTETIALIGGSAIIAFLLIFPSGRFVPRWTVFILAGWTLFQLPRYYFPDSPYNLLISNPLIYNILFIAGVASGPITQLYRYRKVSSPVERQQTKWVVYGLTVGLGGYLAARVLSLILTDPLGSDLVLNLGLAILGVFFMVLLPLSISIAVLLYRLWDINPIINRTLVYGALSASTMAIYIVGVGGLSTYFQNARISYLIAFLATGLIAILFEPLRERLQRGVNRLMYGERDDPAAILSRLSQRVDAALAPESVLPLIVETVAQALRLPYAAIILHPQDEQSRVVAAFGQPADELVRFPLTFRGEPIGEMLLAPRTQGEAFSPADLKLLNIISQQAGVVAHSLNLTTELQQLNMDLQQSREHLVVAQEEERRRLRRDLHDGVGPTLASLSHRIDAAADLVTSDPQASVVLLKELKGQVKGTIAEIRRLVYALRPPVLDEFGLVSAIREHIAPYTGPGGIQVEFDVVEPLPALPAAVEVAAYRIALEAFTNLINHAHASRCLVRIRPEDNILWVEILDDGLGVPEQSHPGVGLRSMRERASELGGECLVEKLPEGGTRVRARLPIIKG